MQAVLRIGYGNAYLLPEGTNLMEIAQAFAGATIVDDKYTSGPKVWTKEGSPDVSIILVNESNIIEETPKNEPTQEETK